MVGGKSRKKPKNGSTAATNADVDSPGNSTFFNGLEVGAASSPTDAVFCYDALLERKKMTIELIESELETAKNNVTEVLRNVAEEIVNANCNYIVDPLCDEGDTFYDVIAKVLLEAADNRGAASRKVESGSGVSSMQPSSSKKPLRRSRSVDPPSQASSMSKTRRFSGPSYNFSSFKTPMTTRKFNFNIATVTPNPNLNLNSTAGILRKPKPGEQAISMSGSPLLVASDFVSSPSVTVPLADGRVFNVMGSSCPMKEHLRHGLDARTKERLRELKNLLSDLVPE